MPITKKKPTGTPKAETTTPVSEKNSSTASPRSKKAASKDLATTRRNNEVGESMGFTPYEAAKDEEYMSEPQQAHFRKILLAWRQSLMEEVDRTVHHMQDDAMNFPDPNDRATQEEEFSLELRARDRERKLIKKINQALTSIEEEDYGYCEACGVNIGIKRLEARPTATMCIDCKTLEEIKEKQTRA